jgi:hypothetical protein
MEFDPDEFLKAVNELDHAAKNENGDIRNLVKKLVPTYQINEEIKNDLCS